MIVAAIVFWLCAGLILYTHLGYPLLLSTLIAVKRQKAKGAAGTATQGRPDIPPQGAAGSADAEARPDRNLTLSGRARAEQLPEYVVSLIVAAYDEQDVIAAKVENALALDWPRERLEVIVASDGSTDATVERARAGGADLVLDLPRGGKIAAQNAAADRARGDVLAFSDANSSWAPSALRRLVESLADPRVGYVCGQVRFTDSGGDNLEGAYWRYEMAVRELESRLGGVTAGNGAIYAVRRDAYLPLAPSGSHDLSFPFLFAKRGLRSVYAPRARAEERMVPTLEGELARKRRMMVGIWDIVVREGMLAPRGYPPLYAFEVLSHRLLRYATPLLHAGAFAANLALLGQGWVYGAAMGAQLALLGAAVLAEPLPLGPLRAARYYVLTTASIALGLWDRWRGGATGAWEKAPGTR